MLRAAILTLFFSIALSDVVYANTLDIPITRQSRKIQHDGFLMEWKMSTARYWDNSGSFIVDAAITSEGVAGYFRSKQQLQCSTWVFTLASSTHNRSYIITIPEDTAQVTSQLRLDKQEFEDNGLVTVEWLIPVPDSFSGTVNETISLSGSSACGDTFPVLRLLCAPENQASPKKTSGLLLKGIIIALLGGMYLLVQRKIKHQTQQKVSPRRSA